MSSSDGNIRLATHKIVEIFLISFWQTLLLSTIELNYD